MKPRLWEQQLKSSMGLYHLIAKTLVSWPEVAVEGRQKSRGCREEEDVKGERLMLSEL